MLLYSVDCVLGRRIQILDNRSETFCLIDVSVGVYREHEDLLVCSQNCVFLQAWRPQIDYDLAPEF